MMTAMAALKGLARAAMMVVRDVNCKGAPMFVSMPSVVAPSGLGSGRQPQAERDANKERQGNG